MFYQNESPEVVRRKNGMEFHRNGFCRESKDESSVKVTLLGYKVMEEKTKFTVYKILVKRAPDQSWVIFRRYTDFSQLHDKLKEMFPMFNSSLPSKRWFNNFSAEFLEERRLGLQDFLQNLVANKDVYNSEAVREFLCLDEPPSAFDSVEDRAFCETNCHLQRTLMDNKCETETLKNFLVHKELEISRPERTMIATHTSQNVLNMLSADTTANGDFLRECEYGEGEKDDPRRSNKSSELRFISSHRACWYGSATDGAFTDIQKNKDLEDHSKNSNT